MCDLILSGCVGIESSECVTKTVGPTYGVVNCSPDVAGDGGLPGDGGGNPVEVAGLRFDGHSKGRIVSEGLLKLLRSAVQEIHFESAGRDISHFNKADEKSN